MGEIGRGPIPLADNNNYDSVPPLRINYQYHDGDNNPDTDTDLINTNTDTDTDLVVDLYWYQYEPRISQFPCNFSKPA